MIQFITSLFPGDSINQCGLKLAAVEINPQTIDSIDPLIGVGYHVIGICQDSSNIENQAFCHHPHYVTIGYMDLTNEQWQQFVSAMDVFIGDTATADISAINNVPTIVVNGIKNEIDKNVVVLNSYNSNPNNVLHAVIDFEITGALWQVGIYERMN
jgi:hypothetical protein